MEEVRPQQQYVHVIADDEHEGKGLALAHQKDDRERRMYCCCFASASMPACCMATYLDPSLYGKVSSRDKSNVQKEIVAFQKAARVTRTIGAAVIKREAASINKRLLRIQKNQASFQFEEQNKKPYKKRRMSGNDNEPQRELSSSPYGIGIKSTMDNAATRATGRSSDEEHTLIWDRVDRMKRLSVFLKNAQLAQSLFLEELNDCLNDGAK